MRCFISTAKVLLLKNPQCESYAKPLNGPQAKVFIEPICNLLNWSCALAQSGKPHYRRLEVKGSKNRLMAISLTLFQRDLYGYSLGNTVGIS